MTDREFKRLKRADLIEIIYRLQENEEQYKKTISRLLQQLEDKQTKIETAGSIAEAALSLSNVFEAAQDAADRYLADIQRMHEEAARVLETAKADAAHILASARQESIDIQIRGDYWA